MAKKAAPKKRIIKGRDYNTDKRSDGLRQAKSGGWRMAGTNRKPTKKEIQAHYDGASNGVYMENRIQRIDRNSRAKKGERFAKGGEIKGIVSEAMDKGESFSDDMKVMLEYKNGRLGITKFFGKNREKSNKTVINNASELSIEELEEKVKTELPKLKLEKFSKGGKIDRTKSTKKTRVNRTKKAIAQDKNIKALHAGKRLSENDEVYYEYRLNRSDVNRTKKLAKGGDLKNYTSADLPKDGSEIKIHMPKMGKFPAEDIVLKYNQDNFAFDAYRNGELSGTRITEKQVLDNLNNGSYEFKDKEVDSTEKYYDTYASAKGEGFDLYYYDESTGDFDTYVDSFKTIEEAKDKAEKEGYKKRPIHMRYAKGGIVKGDEITLKNDVTASYSGKKIPSGTKLKLMATPDYVNKRGFFVYAKTLDGKEEVRTDKKDFVEKISQLESYFEKGGEVGGRGFFGLEKGEEIKDLSKLEKGDIILTYSKQFNSENTLKIVDVRQSGNRVVYDAVYWNPKTDKQIGSEEMSITDINLEWNDYYFPLNYKKGGKLGFEGLAKKVAKEYEGDKVKPEYQSEYGKTYDKEEAKEVGQKVAAKVYREQQGMMEQGGEIKSELTLSEIESKLGKTFGFWDVPYQVSVDGEEYRKKFGSNTYRKI